MAAVAIKKDHLEQPTIHFPEFCGEPVVLQLECVCPRYASVSGIKLRNPKFSYIIMRSALEVLADA
jgi:hypothetical protein